MKEFTINGIVKTKEIHNDKSTFSIKDKKGRTALKYAIIKNLGYVWRDALLTGKFVKKSDVTVARGMIAEAKNKTQDVLWNIEIFKNHLPS